MYYKVMLVSNGELESTTPLSENKLKYKKGEITKPDFGSIFAFKEYKYALHFVTSPDPKYIAEFIQIWKVDGKESPYQPLEVPLFSTYYRPFWEDMGWDNPYIEMMLVPAGTVVLDSVKLIERIYPRSYRRENVN